jgi:glycerol kinase
MNTGERPVISAHGLLTTVAYRIGEASAVYALEGSIAVAGALVQWLRDNLGLIASAGEIEALAASVTDSAGCVLVPAFSGLFAPHWRPDARGVIAGLTAYVNKGHIARAALEAVAWQTREVVAAMAADAGQALSVLKADGGMTANALLMGIIADVLAVPVIRPKVLETTCLGAAYAAGLTVGFWPDLETLRSQWRQDSRWNPSLSSEERDAGYAQWKKAVGLSLGWAD